MREEEIGDVPQALERFEFKQGGSYKFWETTVEGSVLVVRFGKIGTEGRINRQTFPSPEAAIAEKQKRVREKVRKGYTPTFNREGLDVKAESKLDPVKKIETRKTEGKGVEYEDTDLTVSISRDATFADLFNSIDAIEEEIGDGELLFEAELVDNFSADFVDEVLAFRDMPSSRVTRVLTFFKERGYSQSDIIALLPVKFKRERKQK